MDLFCACPLHRWTGQAKISVTTQVDRTGKAIKVDADGFPDVASLDLETDQNQLRYEAYQAMAAQQAKIGPSEDDGSSDTNPGRIRAWEQGQQSSSSRTPFADSRPQTDRYAVALLGLNDDFLGLHDDLVQGTNFGSLTDPSCGNSMLLAETDDRLADGVCQVACVD